MADRHSPEVRSRNMSLVKGKNTKLELLVRKYLHAQGFRFRLHVSDLPGKPDLVLPKYRTVIFVNGCFWHGHKNCKYFTVPKTRTDWWLNKIHKNIAKDLLNKDKLSNAGWVVIYVWGCELKKSFIDLTLSKLTSSILENQ
jgi:DNA mismatch endonuclease (patch repair protein)